MTCIGKVSEGKVILPPGVHLPKGAEVELRARFSELMELLGANPLQ